MNVCFLVWYSASKACTEQSGRKISGIMHISLWKSKILAIRIVHQMIIHIHQRSNKKGRVTEVLGILSTLLHRKAARGTLEMSEWNSM